MSRFTHNARLKKRLQDASKGLKAFRWFLILIADASPVYCFLCGNYIHPITKSSEQAFKPFGKRGEWVHNSCYKEGITYEIANQKIDENSLLICHYQIFTTFHPEGVCRTKVRNDSHHLIRHLNITHDVPMEEIARERKKCGSIQSAYFLKPTGKKFAKSRVV